MLEQFELAELAKQADTVQERLAAITKSLIPYYVRRRKLRNEIAQTHIGHWDGPIYKIDEPNFEIEAVAQRTPIFPELDRLNHEHAPVVDEERRVKAQLRGLIDRIDMLKKIIAKAQQ